MSESQDQINNDRLEAYLESDEHKKIRKYMEELRERNRYLIPVFTKGEDGCHVVRQKEVSEEEFKQWKLEVKDEAGE